MARDLQAEEDGDRADLIPDWLIEEPGGRWWCTRCQPPVGSNLRADAVLDPLLHEQWHLEQDYPELMLPDDGT